VSGDDDLRRDAPQRDETPVTGLSTGNRGQQIESVDNDVAGSGHPRKSGGPVSTTGDDGVDDTAPPAAADLAASVLAGARRMSAGRFRRRDREAAGRTRRDNLAGRRSGQRNRGGYSGAGPDPARDPQRIGAVIEGYVTEQGWQRPLAEARVFAEWPALVGREVADHCAPQSLTDGELRITAESTAWATQLRLLASTVLARLVAELGSEVVRKLVITGPVAPSWKHGGRSVRGGRGPRDTYG